MKTSERHMLCSWQDYVTRRFRFFTKRTGSRALLADFYAAINDEILYLRRAYPGVEEKRIVERAYARLLEAYERSEEYPVYLNWRSIAKFTANKRPGIAWAVLQARADRQAGAKPECKNGERPFMPKKIRSTQMAWCPYCYLTARTVAGKHECCGRAVDP